MTLTAAVRCNICGTIPCASMAEAERRAERHVGLTGHTVTTEARVT